MPLEYAASFTLPIGKHAGRTLAEIAATDIGYLRWAADTLDKSRLREVITSLLAHHEATPRQTTPEEARR